MAEEIFDESHYFICESGLKPARMKKNQEILSREDGHYYLTEFSLKCNGIDFSCKWAAILYAIVAAAIALLMSCPAGWVLLAAIAGAVMGAALGATLCGDMAAVMRMWLVIKDNLQIGEHNTVANRGSQHLICNAFGSKISFKPNVTNEFEAICLFGANILLTGLEGFMYVYAFRGGGLLLSAPKTFLRNFGVNYLKTLSVKGVLGRSVFGVYGEANAYYMSDTKGFDGEQLAKASAQSFFFAETALYHAATEADPQSIALLLSMGGIPGRRKGDAQKGNITKEAKQTATEWKNTAEKTKVGINKAIDSAKEFRKKLKAQKKGDGAHEEYSGGRGKYSNRPFNVENAGGSIENLSWKNTEITKDGIDIVKEHTSRFEADPANQKMIERLEAIERGELEITDYDKRYYTHGIKEYKRYTNLGVKNGIDPGYDVWNDTHTATLEDYKINEIEQPLYHPDTLE